MSNLPDALTLERSWRNYQIITPNALAPSLATVESIAAALAAPTRLMIDVSDWDPILKASELEGHISAIGAKFGEVDDRVISLGWNSNMSVAPFMSNSFPDHAQTAADIGVPLVAYIYDNPSYKMQWYGPAWRDHSNDVDAQVLLARRALKNKRYHAVAIDLERWFKFYNQYLAMLRGEIPGSQVEKIPSLWIVNSGMDLRDRYVREIKAGNFNCDKLWVYFGKWFIDGYAPELDTLVSQMIQWNVGYMPNATAAGFKSWDTIRDYVATMPMPMQSGNKWSEVQQVTDKFVFPGHGAYYADGTTPHAVDVNRINIADMTQIFTPGDWSGDIPTPPPPPPPVEKKKFAIAVSTVLRIRTQPDTSTLSNIIAQPVAQKVEFEVLSEKVVGSVTFGEARVWIGLKDGPKDLCTVTER